LKSAKARLRGLPLSLPTTTGVPEPLGGGRFFPAPTRQGPYSISPPDYEIFWTPDRVRGVRGDNL